MIDPKDIRIGNWLKIREQYIIQVFDMITKEWFAYKEQQACGYSDAEPIPLTVEILLKCGFKEVDYHHEQGYIFYNYPNMTISYNYKDGKFREYNIVEDDPYFSWHGHEFKFLHKLQNFYYEQNDEELNYIP